MLLPTCQWYFPCRCGKRGIQIMQIFLCQMNGKASEIIFHMGYITGFGYGNDTGLTHRPRQCDLCRRYIESAGESVSRACRNSCRASVQRPKSNRDLPRSIKAADSGVPACTPGAHNAHTAKASNKFRFFRIRHLNSYKGQIYENLPFFHIGKRNICRGRIPRKPPLLHLSKIIPTLRRH